MKRSKWLRRRRLVKKFRPRLMAADQVMSGSQTAERLTMTRRSCGHLHHSQSFTSDLQEVITSSQVHQQVIIASSLRVALGARVMEVFRSAKTAQCAAQIQILCTDRYAVCPSMRLKLIRITLEPRADSTNTPI